MTSQKALLYITYILILCGVARGIPLLNAIPLAACKLIMIILSIGYLIANPDMFIDKAVKYISAFIFYMSLLYFLTDNANVTYYSNTLAAMLIIAPFYYYSKRGLVTQKNFTVFSVALLLVICYSFYYTRTQSIFERGSENVTTNYGYFFATILPIIFVIKKKWINYIIVFISIIGGIISAKRGVMVITIMIGMYFYYITLYHNSKKTKIINIVITILVLSITSYYVYKTMLESDQFLWRLEMTLDGNTNGRDNIGKMCMDYVRNEGIFNLLFGNGYFSTIQIVGIEAHNDWLQALVDYGILGLFLYISFILSLIKEAWITLNINHRRLIFVILIIWIIKSLFSMQYCNFNSILIMMALGIVLGDKLRRDEDSLFN